MRPSRRRSDRQPLGQLLGLEVGAADEAERTGVTVTLTVQLGKMHMNSAVATARSLGFLRGEASLGN